MLKSQRAHLCQIQGRRHRRTAQGTSSIRIDTAAASGDRVVKIEDMSFAYGDRPVIRHFTADILRGERIGVVGGNGAGKTTLLKLLTGARAPTSGAVTLGTRVEMAFFDQLHAQLDPALTVKEVVAQDERNFSKFMDKGVAK